MKPLPYSSLIQDGWIRSAGDFKQACASARYTQEFQKRSILQGLSNSIYWTEPQRWQLRINEAKQGEALTPRSKQELNQ